MVETDDIEWVRVEPTRLDVEYQEYMELEWRHLTLLSDDIRQERCRHLVVLGVPESLWEQV